MKPRNISSSTSRPIGGATVITKNDVKRTRRTFQKVARELFKENPFCRQDFWVLEADVDFRGSFLRGECNDLATDEDRTRFVDTLTNW